MTIESEKVGSSTVIMYLSGRLDTTTAPQLERKLKQWGEETPEVILDFLDLTYISSMGLRVLLQTQKMMKAQNRKLVIRHMNDSIKEVFEMTGFINLMVQEEKFVIIKKEEADAVVFSLIGEMDSNNVSTLAEGLKAALAENPDRRAVLDAGKLSLLTAPAGKLIKELIEKSGWKKGELSIENVSDKIRKTFDEEGLGDWLKN